MNLVPGCLDDLVVRVENAGLTSLCFQVLEQHRDPTEIYVDYNEISHITTDFFSSCGHTLKKLSLVGNELCSLPDNVSALLVLEELFVNENNLNSLPNALLSCTKLRILNIVGNKIERLPEKLGHWKLLEEIYADENVLTHLPEAFTELPSLSVVELADNKIKCLPNDLGSLMNLTVLNVAHNKITVVPDSLGDVPQLSVLDLSENFIEVLPNHFKSHACITRIYIDTNRLITVPQWFNDMPEIREISIRNNQLCNKPLSDKFGHISLKLKSLDLSGNHIEEIPSTIGNLQSLQFFHFGSVIGELERKNFQNGNWLTTIPKSFVQLFNLKKITLEENQIAELPEDFGNLVNLEFIDLGQNQLRRLPESFGKLRSLVSCQVSKNHIEALPDSIGQLGNLLDLRLDNNLIEELPESFRLLRQLKYLDLFNNCLRQVPPCLKDLTSLISLDIAENQIPLHHLKVPHKETQINYAPRDPSLKQNWRGRPRQDIGDVTDPDLRVFGNGEVPDEPEPAPEPRYNEEAINRALRASQALWKSHDSSKNDEREKFVHDTTTVNTNEANSENKSWKQNKSVFSTAGWKNKLSTKINTDSSSSMKNASHMRTDQTQSTLTEEDWDTECHGNTSGRDYWDPTHRFVPGERHPINIVNTASHLPAVEGQFDDL